MSGSSPGTEGYWSDLDDDEPDTRVVHISEDPDVVIGRNGGTNLLTGEIGELGWLGNPYVLESHGGDFTREESVARFAEDLLELVDESEEYREALYELQGARLGCYCRREGADEPLCHGDVLVDVINAIEKVGGDQA